MPHQPRLLALIMAGGKGSRLFPLTRDRAKPAVPFGGRYRIIDFVLSNMVNSGIRSVYVLTQYKAQSLVEHVQRAWGSRNSHSDFVTVVPAQMRMGESWYRGTADSVFQNFHMVEDCKPDLLLVFGADHIYKMNVRQMVDFHRERDALATVACIPVAVEEASQFGIMEVDSQGRIIGFEEKPQSNPKTIPGDPTRCLASMGNYIFHPEALAEALLADARRESRHDFGHDVIPVFQETGRAYAYNFYENRIPGAKSTEENIYWRDVGTIDAYYEAALDLKNVVPALNLYGWEWPIMTASYSDPPLKMVFDDPGRRGTVLQSTVAGGCIIAGGFVKDSVLGRNVFVDEGAEVRDSVIFDNVYIGKGARIQRAIIDKNVRVAEGDLIGHDLARDALRHVVSEGGVTVVAKARDTLTTRLRDYG
ncbi:MAG: glucose-1-phosphate adenylyltransferase [Deltaproteobacteria bacterium]|nr:glucose-1-phosphate adenylyltransferase [Deltaproteobacteria bacterium]